MAMILLEKIKKIAIKLSDLEHPGKRKIGLNGEAEKERVWRKTL